MEKPMDINRINLLIFMSTYNHQYFFYLSKLHLMHLLHPYSEPQEVCLNMLNMKTYFIELKNTSVSMCLNGILYQILNKCFLEMSP